MMCPAPLQFVTRACPLCGSAAGQSLLHLSGDAIFKSNWSYRQGGAARLALAKEQVFPIDECGVCGFIYARLLPSRKFLDEIYEHVIDAEAVRAANLSRASIALKMGDMSTLFQIAASPGLPVRVLDYGCGFGPALEVMRILPGVQSLGFETSAVRLHDLSRRGIAATGDLAIAASQGPYDVVLLDNVLEHLPQPREVLEFVRSVSAPSAVIYVSVPAISRKTIADQRGAAQVRMDINPWEHLNYFDVEHLDKLLQEFDFHPLGRLSFPHEVPIGLRASPELGRRIMNGLATIARLCRFVWTGEGLASVTQRFYRLDIGALRQGRAMDETT
jgi:SAM-dependent methyltransferase